MADRTGPGRRSAQTTDAGPHVDNRLATTGCTVRAADPLRAVVLEDDEIDASLFSLLLQRAWPSGAEITVFATLGDLVRGIGDHSPDVVFCDLALPDGRGVEVVERTLEAVDEVPVVVLTGNADPAMAELALQLGAQDYLTKGEFDTETLARTLRYSIARGAADREIRRIARDLARLNRELDQFAGIVAHDLRAPIRTARLFADRLVAEAERGNELDPLSSALDCQLERMESLVSRLLQMASLRDDDIGPVEERLSDIINDVRADLLADLEAGGATLRCAGDGILTADPILIRKVFRNLVENSIRYRSPDRLPVITASLTRTGSTVEVTVSDNGLGVEPRHRERAFDLFERLTPDDGAPGMGFGLAFSRQIMERHDGWIGLDEPIESVGATVRLLLPAGRSTLG